jgi:hypothetical protein
MKYTLIAYRKNGERTSWSCIVGAWNSDCNVSICDSREQLEERIKFIKGLDIDGEYDFTVIQGGELIREFGDCYTRYSDEEWSKE